MVNIIEPYTPRPNHTTYLRSQDSLSYIEFLQAVEYMWTESHPDVPFYAKDGDKEARYPCIIYSLESRMPVTGEPKPKLRENIQTSKSEHTTIQILGQRFQNFIRFSVITESDPHLAETILEAFEDFMSEFIPVLKKLGASEILYHNRPRDTSENRSGPDSVSRAVIFMVILEKVTRRDIQKLESIYIDVRRYIQDPIPPPIVYYGDATPTYSIIDQHGIQG